MTYKKSSNATSTTHPNTQAMPDFLLPKKASIERCIKQARAYYALPSETPFANDFLKQDAIAANLQRAIDQCRDMANHIIRTKKLGMPATPNDSFNLLKKARIINADMATKMSDMYDFRHTLMHQFTDLDPKEIAAITQHHSDDLLTFAKTLTTPPK